MASTDCIALNWPVLRYFSPMKNPPLGDAASQRHYLPGCYYYRCSDDDGAVVDRKQWIAIGVLLLIVVIIIILFIVT